jgi:hypothetical protein
MGTPTHSLVQDEVIVACHGLQLRLIEIGNLATILRTPLFFCLTAFVQSCNYFNTWLHASPSVEKCLQVAVVLDIEDFFI